MDKDTPCETIAIPCISIFTSIPESEEERTPRQVREEQIKEGITWAFFDGASNQRNICGERIVIHLNAQKCLKSSMGLGAGTNNFVELQTLKLLLCWLIHLGLRSVQIFSDSQNVIKWFNGEYRCQNYMLIPLLE